MKQSLYQNTMVLLIALSFCLSASAQKKTEYKASNGITYHIGDTVMLSRGSSPEGKFMYVQRGGWAKTFFDTDSQKGASQYDLDRSYAGSAAVIKKIKGQKYRGVERVIFVVGVGAITNYDLMIEDAIATCEIKDCKGKVDAVAQAPVSGADELAKYKKLLDQGAISKTEYEAMKKKLLGL